MILRCPKCLFEMEGEFNEKLPPGRCLCGKSKYWKVVKTFLEPGFVRVLTDDGWKELHGPNWTFHPANR